MACPGSRSRLLRVAAGGHAALSPLRPGGPHRAGVAEESHTPWGSAPPHCPSRTAPRFPSPDRPPRPRPVPHPHPGAAVSPLQARPSSPGLCPAHWSPLPPSMSRLLSSPSWVPPWAPAAWGLKKTRPPSPPLTTRLLKGQRAGEARAGFPRRRPLASPCGLARAPLWLIPTRLYLAPPSLRTWVPGTPSSRPFLHVWPRLPAGFAPARRWLSPCTSQAPGLTVPTSASPLHSQRGQGLSSQPSCSGHGGRGQLGAVPSSLPRAPWTLLEPSRGVTPSSPCPCPCPLPSIRPSQLLAWPLS